MRFAMARQLVEPTTLLLYSSWNSMTALLVDEVEALAALASCFRFVRTNIRDPHDRSAHNHGSVDAGVFIEVLITHGVVQHPSNCLVGGPRDMVSATRTTLSQRGVDLRRGSSMRPHLDRPLTRCVRTRQGVSG